MENMNDSENAAKISDSAYSNSCSNSQSRRSRSSKSTRFGSNSSGSSGYGGKPSTSTYCNNIGKQTDKRSKDKDGRKKKHLQPETSIQGQIKNDCRPTEILPASEADNNDITDVVPESSQGARAISESEKIEARTSESIRKEVESCGNSSVNTTANVVACRSVNPSIGFSCVISMHDGVVMYTTASITAALGFPKDMWIGRSFIDFIHPRDRSTFASQITNGLAVPKNANGMEKKAPVIGNSISKMACRIRQYRGLTTGFAVTERDLNYMPFLLKLSFKDIGDDEGKVIYLIIQAIPFFSAFKTPNEAVVKSVPFVIRHSANGTVEYVDPESVPFLGFLPQDLVDKDALQLYHPDDLPYLRQAYETIVKEGRVARSKPCRLMTQNGTYLKLETEWNSFTNPWSRKLEFVIGKHYIFEGPSNPDVFEPPVKVKVNEEEKNKAQALRESVVKIMKEVLTKPAEVAKQQMTKRCQDLATFMESLIEEQPKVDEELRLDIQDPDCSYYSLSKAMVGKELDLQERDSVMLGGISPHHDYSDSKSSTETPLSYNQLNYNETLQRYFASHQPYSYDDYNTVNGENILMLNVSKGRSPSNNCLSPFAQYSGESGDTANTWESGPLVGESSLLSNMSEDYQPIRLTELLLTKHNAEKENELVKIHRGTRINTKGERDKATNESRQKTKEHLARCKAGYQPTNAEISTIDNQIHGVKRASMQTDVEAGANKHHCSVPRQSRRLQSTSATFAQPSATVTTTIANDNWPTGPARNMNTFILGVGIPQQMPILTTMATRMPPCLTSTIDATMTARMTPSMASTLAPRMTPGMAPGMTPGIAPCITPNMFPIYYAAAPPPLPPPQMQNTSGMNLADMSMNNQRPPVPCMLYGQPMYGQPFMYSPMSYPMQQDLMSQTVQYSNPAIIPLALANRNYEESTETALASSCSFISKNKSSQRLGNSEEPVDRTDGESSYSSFYSSFFKTESGSAEESSDAKKNGSTQSEKG